MSFMLFQFCFTNPQRPYRWILKALKDNVVVFWVGFFCMLGQQGPKAKKTKRVLNPNHAVACVCVDPDQRPKTLAGQIYQHRNCVQKRIASWGALHSDNEAVAKAWCVFTICFRKT